MSKHNFWEGKKRLNITGNNNSRWKGGTINGMSRKDWQKNYWKFNPIGRYAHYRNSAKHRGLSFEITLEQFKSFWGKDCTYCGSKIETIGLDRLDSDVGYLLENLVPCCSICNSMKKKLPKNVFINQCIKITKFNY